MWIWKQIGIIVSTSWRMSRVAPCHQSLGEKHRGILLADCRRKQSNRIWFCISQFQGCERVTFLCFTSAVICYRSHRKLIQGGWAVGLSHIWATSECDGVPFCDFIKSTRRLVRERLQQMFEVGPWGHMWNYSLYLRWNPVGLEDMTLTSTSICFPLPSRNSGNLIPSVLWFYHLKCATTVAVLLHRKLEGKRTQRVVHVWFKGLSASVG